ncbi:MAG: outer membrane beta-barrel protein [Alphaproteobacteria bacterium]|nr:outer membrane beta-barrel protein [Alphaproteobacteria bacterium]
MKRKLLFAGASLLVLGVCAPASAADLAVAPIYSKAPAMVSAIYDWSGLYLGLNGGGGWTRVRNANPDVYDDFSGNGGTFGGQIGYRWQLSNWVFGVEGQGNWADFSADVTKNWPGSTETGTVHVNSFGLFTGQIGYAWNNVLLYVKGGGAVVSNKIDSKEVALDGSTLYTASGSLTKWGGTVGVGLDYGFAPNWSLGLEWNHVFVAGQNFSENYVDAGGSYTADARVGRQNIDMGLVRLNYRFGGPAVARY